MSDIPDDIMKAARGISEGLLFKPTYERAEIIARAIMAADEAATKRERERCVKISKDWADFHENRIVDGMSGVSALNFAATANAGDDIADAILKGDA